MKKIEIFSHDPNWPVQFNEEAKRIHSALGQNCVAIHHIGSTSVPELAAKPKIDIIAEVERLTFKHEKLTNIGYEYRGGFNLPTRKSFTFRSEGLNVNLHVFEKNDPEIELNLLFRDYLRNSKTERDRYAQLKYELLKDEASHKKDGKMYKGYTLGKHDLVDEIIRKTGFNRLRFTICTHLTE